jgi:UDPglucose 6-dehydrogenase
MKEKIVKIETENYDGDVYNLEIIPQHKIKDDQFFLDNDTGIVIHNCHPRDNIALRFMAEKLDLGYDLFDAVMNAREKQAKNMAKKLVELSDEYNLPIIILGQSFKPDVDSLEGSSSVLVGHYVQGMEKGVIFDPLIPIRGVYLLGHMGKHHDYPFPEESVILDPWRMFISTDLTVIHYGNTRKNCE